LIQSLTAAIEKLVKVPHAQQKAENVELCGAVPLLNTQVTAGCHIMRAAKSPGRNRQKFNIPHIFGRP